MKRIFVLLLSLALLCSMGLSAYAIDDPSYTYDENTVFSKNFDDFNGVEDFTCNVDLLAPECDIVLDFSEMTTDYLIFSFLYGEGYHYRLLYNVNDFGRISFSLCSDTEDSIFVIADQIGFEDLKKIAIHIESDLHDKESYVFVNHFQITVTFENGSGETVTFSTPENFGDFSASHFPADFNISALISSRENMISTGVYSYPLNFYVSSGPGADFACDVNITAKAKVSQESENPGGVLNNNTGNQNDTDDSKELTAGDKIKRVVGISLPILLAVVVFSAVITKEKKKPNRG